MTISLFVLLHERPGVERSYASCLGTLGTRLPGETMREAAGIGFG